MSLFHRRLAFGLGLTLAVSNVWAQQPTRAPSASPVKTTSKTSSDVYAPESGPDRIILTWNGDPATSQSVTWRTDASVDHGVAQLAESEDGPSFARSGGRMRTLPAVTTPLSSDTNLAHYHSVTFDHLTPKTKYVYRVGDGKTWSEWFQFETPSNEPAPLKFIYFGDAQNDIKQHWSRVIRGAYSSMPAADFIIHAGDLVDNGNSDRQWGEWHEAAGWINGMVPSIPTPGNHEYSGPRNRSTLTSKASTSGLTEHWRPQFCLPENGPEGLEESAYYLDIQGVRIISLNSNERQREQVAWLESVLASNPHRWTVVTFHHPVYSTAKGRDNKTIRELWRPLIDKYHVDLVLTGHDHSYGRSGLMREDNLLTGTNVREGGTVYVVSVSGPKLYSVDHQPWMMSNAQESQLYQLITIDGDRLHYESRTARGDLYDGFDLEKQFNGINTLVEANTAAEPTKIAAPPSDRRQVMLAIGAILGITLVVGVTRLIRSWLVQSRETALRGSGLG